MTELIEKAAKDLVDSRHAIALTGAGMSTESGIPDFRGPDGLWTRDPEAERKAYEAYEIFRQNPRKFWEERINPESPLRRAFDVFGQLNKAMPNPGHYALAELEKMGILKFVLTQNIDGLHTKAGNLNVVEYHGGINKFRCIGCGKRFTVDRINPDKLTSADKLPPLCECGGIIKDDGVFFGEPIPDDSRRISEEQAVRCDLMLICGTSAVVYPFADLPSIAKFGAGRFGTVSPPGSRENVTVIEVNAEPTPLTGRISDYLIQGRTGEILPRILKEVQRISG
ncbi:MAG: NAD-dependent deacylase [Desulfobacterales bacterium]